MKLRDGSGLSFKINENIVLIGTWFFFKAIDLLLIDSRRLPCATLVTSLSAFPPVVAERGNKRQWAQDPSSSGEDPPAEGDKTGAAHRPHGSVQLQIKGC